MPASKYGQDQLVLILTTEEFHNAVAAIERSRQSSRQKGRPERATEIGSKTNSDHHDEDCIFVA